MKGKFKCLGEKAQKYINFSVPIEKELDNGKATKYKINFIHSFRFHSLSKLVDILSERLQNDKYTQFVNLILTICQSKIVDSSLGALIVERIIRKNLIKN